jgi:hypothetical protein
MEHLATLLVCWTVALAMTLSRRLAEVADLVPDGSAAWILF